MEKVQLNLSLSSEMFEASIFFLKKPMKSVSWWQINGN